MYGKQLECGKFIRNESLFPSAPSSVTPRYQIKHQQNNNNNHGFHDNGMPVSIK